MVCGWLISGARFLVQQGMETHAAAPLSPVPLLHWVRGVTAGVWCGTGRQGVKVSAPERPPRGKEIAISSARIGKCLASAHLLAACSETAVGMSSALPFSILRPYDLISSPPLTSASMVGPFLSTGILPTSPPPAAVEPQAARMPVGTQDPPSQTSVRIPREAGDRVPLRWFW